MFCNLSEFSMVDYFFDVHFLSLTQYPVNKVHGKHASSNTHEANDQPKSASVLISPVTLIHIMFKTLHHAKQGQ